MEAIYNLGLVNMHLGLPGDSLQAFEKLHTIIPNNTEVIYHIANLYEVGRFFILLTLRGCGVTFFLVTFTSCVRFP